MGFKPRAETGEGGDHPAYGGIGIVRGHIRTGVRARLRLAVLALALAAGLALASPAGAGATYHAALVKDINPGAGNSYPGNVNGAGYFAADDGAHGFELWRSDGTEAGTTMGKDINPGPGDTSPLWFTDVNGTLFFRADDGVHGTELWKSDGTEAGTTMVKDINPGHIYSRPADSSPGGFTKVNGALFFSADDGAHGRELWKSDGTEAGTELFKDINPGSGDSFPGGGFIFKGTLFFTADDG